MRHGLQTPRISSLETTSVAKDKEVVIAYVFFIVFVSSGLLIFAALTESWVPLAAVKPRFA